MIVVTYEHPQILFPSFYLPLLHLSSPVFLVLGVLGWILSTLDASLQELQSEGSSSQASKGGVAGLKVARGGLKHRKPAT